MGFVKKYNASNLFLFRRGRSFLLLPPLPARTVLFDINMRESFELDCLFDELFQFHEIGIRRLARESASGGFCEFHRVERNCIAAVRSGEGLGSERSGGGCLAGREGVVLVVEDEIGDGVVPAAGMEEVSETDPVSVTVSSDTKDFELGIRELDPQSERERSPMKGFCRVAVDVLRSLPAAADPTHDDDLVFRDSEFLYGFADGSEDHEIPASGAPLYEI